MSFVSHFFGSFCDAPMVRDFHCDQVRAQCIFIAVTTDEGMERRFGEFLGERIGRHFRRREQKESFALSAHGIVADGERKSVEPIAARATGAGNDDDEEPGVLCERTQARLLNFLRDSPWDDRSYPAARSVTANKHAHDPVSRRRREPA